MLFYIDNIKDFFTCKYSTGDSSKVSLKIKTKPITDAIHTYDLRSLERIWDNN